MVWGPDVIHLFFFYDNIRICLVFFQLYIFQMADTNFDLDRSYGILGESDPEFSKYLKRFALQIFQDTKNIRNSKSVSQILIFQIFEIRIKVLKFRPDPGILS